MSQDFIAAARGRTLLQAFQRADRLGHALTFRRSPTGLTLRVGPAEGPGPRVVVHASDLDGLLARLAEALAAAPRA